MTRYPFILQLVGAAFGAAGQRCMALSTAVFVGEAKEWIPELVERARKLTVNAGKRFVIFALFVIFVNLKTMVNINAFWYHFNLLR